MITKIGVVADDVTGSNDIGAKFKNGGLSAYIFNYQMVQQGYKANDVVIVDTDSRLIDPDSAYQRVYEASRFLASKGTTQFFNKTCSVFRGNIGAEFDAMLDSLSENFAVVVLGFPDNGRQTIDGIHYVHGKPLELSEFANDPVNPMRKSSLVDILSAQTRRNVVNIACREYDKGVAHVTNIIEKAREKGGYLIFDIRDNKDLSFVASMIYQEKIICGASAIAEELARYHNSQYTGALSEKIPDPDLGILIAAGSLMPQTVAQINWIHDAGAAVYEINADLIFDSVKREQEISNIVEYACSVIRSGRDCIIHTPNSSQKVAEVKSAGKRCGYEGYSLSKLISSTLARICHEAIEKSGQSRIIIMGGDTSNSFCEEMGILGLEVGNEIESGLPTCISIGYKPLLLVLKSGSFGSREFLSKAIMHLKSYK